MGNINEAIEEVQEKYEVIPNENGQSLKELIRIAENKYSNNAQKSNAENPLYSLYANTAAPFAIGAANMMNDTVLGGLGYGLGVLGRGVESISPFSGRDDDLELWLWQHGANKDYIDKATPYRDSWLTSGAKATLAGHNYASDALDNYEQQVFGENPNFIQEVFKGSGSSIGYLLSGYLLGATPLSAALWSAASEAISETGGFLGDAYRNGQYDNGALGVATQSLLANLALNSLLNSIVGHFEPNVENATGAFNLWTKRAGEQVLNEILQEPSQQVIERAAQNTLYGTDGFLSNLGEAIKEWPQTFTQLLPSVTGSTLLTEILLAPFGAKHFRNHHTMTNEEIDALNAQQFENLKHQREQLQNQINDIISKPYPEDFDSQIDTAKNISDLDAQIQNLDDQIANFWGNNQDLDLFPDAENDTNTNNPSYYNSNFQNSTGETQNTAQDNAQPDSSSVLPPLNALLNNPANNSQPDGSTVLPPLTALPDNQPEQQTASPETLRMNNSALSDNDKTQTTYFEPSQRSESYSQPLYDKKGKNLGDLNFLVRGKNNSLQVAAVENYDYNNDRVMRYRGPRSILLHTKTGKIIATYFPNINAFYFSPQVSRSQSSVWQHNLEDSFIHRKDEFLRQAGWLDENGKISPDGNEGFRLRWEQRFEREGAEGRNAFYLDEAQPEDFDTQTTQTERLSPQTEQTAKPLPEQKTQPQKITAPQKKRSKKDTIRDTIENIGEKISRSMGNSEIYHQPFTLDFDGKNYYFSIEAHHFPSNLNSHRKLFGTVLDIKDENGSTVARYSPYTDTFQFAKGVQDPNLQQAITAKLFGSERLKGYLFNAGLLDNNGSLIDDGNYNFRNSYYSGKARKKSKQTLSPEEQKKSRRSVGKFLKETAKSKKDAVLGALKDEADFWKHKGNQVKRAFGVAAEKTSDIFENKKAKDLRDSIQKALRDLPLKGSNGETTQLLSEDYIEPVSRVLAASALRFSSYTGLTPEAWLKARGFEVNYDPSFRATLIYDKNSEIKGQKRGDYEYKFQPRDKENNIIREANNIITLLQTSDHTTLIHELGHFYFSNFRDLLRTGKLKGLAKQDWNTIIKWTNIEDIDLTKDKDEMTLDEQARLTNAHEQFAVGFEKFITTGKAPTTKLMRAFETLKRWMLTIYKSVKDIKFRGSDGEDHAFELSPEIKKVYGHLFTDINNDGVTSSTQNSSTNGESEIFNQHLGRQNSIRDVLDIMKTEKGQKNSGNVWADYATVSPEQARRISLATGLDINDNYVHTIIGSAVTHTLNRHGEGNEQRNDQLPVTDADFELLPDIINHADEISLGSNKTTGNLNDTIVYQKRINGHVLIVEEVRKGRKKLAFHTMRKAKAGYVYDLSREGQPITKENAKSEGVNVLNDIQSVTGLPNALSTPDSLAANPSNVNSENYNQQARNPQEKNLSPKARSQLNAVRKKYQNTSQWLKAPNGKDTNLSEFQWLQVRTPNFKKWFGDWENNPQNSSKVLDENGEPLVVYHGTPHGGFSVFDTKGEGLSRNTGAWFTSRRENAQSYEEYEGEGLYETFLNIRNPYIIEGNGRSWDNLGETRFEIEDTQTGEFFFSNDNGDDFSSSDEAEDFINSKIDDGSFTLSDKDAWPYKYDPDTGEAILYERFIVHDLSDNEFSHTNDIVRGVFNGELVGYDVDGVIFKNIYDTGPYSLGRYLSDVFVTRSPQNIKSATDNNGNFNPNDKDIYHQIIGEQGARNLDKADGLTVRIDNLNVARNMEHKGVNPNTIWLATGWMRGTDGKWRYEILDGKIKDIIYDRRTFKKAKKQYDALFDAAYDFDNDELDLSKLQDKQQNLFKKLEKNFANLTLQDVFDAPQLFDAYPELKDYGYDEADWEDDTYGVTWDTLIMVNSNLRPEQIRFTLIHEIQHTIQDIEGFAKGSSQKQFEDKPNIFEYNSKGEINVTLLLVKPLRRRALNIYRSLKPDTRKLFRNLRDKQISLNKNQFNQLIHQSLNRNQLKLFNEFNQLLTDAQNIDSGNFTQKDFVDTFFLYNQTAGEVEARNTQKRRNWDISKRRFTPLDKSEDTPRNSQFIWDQDSNPIFSPKPYSQLHFVSPNQIERYQQIAFHGTDNRILGNRFNLKFAGSSEGTASRGYGAYLAQNKAVAETYRHFGDIHNGAHRITLTTNDGKVFHSRGQHNWDRGTNAFWQQTLDDLYSLAVHDDNPNLDSIKKDLLKNYRRELREQKHELSLLQRELKNNPRNDTQDRIELQKSYINNSNEKINAVKSFSQLSVLPPKSGNVYSFDIPENDTLLDWDKHITRQPELIKKARKEILQELKYWGFDNSEVKKAKNGEQFYRALAKLMDFDDKNFAYPQKGIYDNQQRASLILNLHGVPGLRYLDSGSRENNNRKGTHNFVIWDTDTLSMLGLEGNKEDEDYFSRTKLEHSQVQDPNNKNSSTDIQIELVRKKYQNTALWLKAPNGKNSILNENQWLIVRTTNFKNWFGDWENDPDNASKVLDENGEPLVVYTGTPHGGFSVFDMSAGTHKYHFGAYFSPNKDYAMRYLFSDSGGHQGQHPQVYEVFLNFRQPFDTRNKKEANIYWNMFYMKYGEAAKLSEHDLLKPVEADDMFEFLRDNDYHYDAILLDEGRDFDSTTGKSTWRGVSYVAFYPQQIKSATNNNGYFSNDDPDIYHQSTLSPDFLNSEDLISDKDFEFYNQDHFHGTGHIILNNSFDFEKIGSGEGGQFRGWGIYSAEERNVSQTYRRFGIDGITPFGDRILSVTFLNGETLQNFADMSNFYSWSGNPKQEIINALNDLYRLLTQRHGIDNKTALQNLSSIYKERIENLKQTLEFLRNITPSANENFFARNSREAQIKNLPREISSLQKSLEALLSIKHVSLGNMKKGNIYNVWVSDYSTRLDWDAALHEQPELVQIAIPKINTFIHRLAALSNIDTTNFDNSDTGGSLYMNIADIMKLYLKNHPHPRDGVTQSKKRSSLLFNSFGIPGLRFLDRVSRNNYNTDDNTYNCVTWNKNAIHITGIDPDSDKEAFDYFNNYKHEHPDAFIPPDTIEHYNQLAFHGTKNILQGNRFNLRFINSGQGAQSYGYGIYLAQNKDVATAYRRAGMSTSDTARAFIVANNGKSYQEIDFFDYIRDNLKDWGLHDKNDINLIASSFTEHIVDFVDGNYNSIHDAVLAYIQETSRLTAQENKNYSDIIKKVARLLAPLNAIKGQDKKGNLYSADIPDDYKLLDWDALMSEQPPHVLYAIKNAGIDFSENQTGGQFYKDLADNLFFSNLTSDFNLDENLHLDNFNKSAPYMLASLKLNELGIPGLRYFDAGSRNHNSGSHNFVIWNTDTIRLLGISDDSELDAQDYYRAQDFYNSQLDSLDNDSDIIDYSNKDYEQEISHLDDFYNSSLDAQDEDGFSEIYNQSPVLERFDNPESERAFSDALNPHDNSNSALFSIRNILHGFKGDFPDLAGNPDFIYAREVLRKLGRMSDANTLQAVKSLEASLRNLNSQQLNTFSRLMLINDLYNFKRYNPNSKLPLNFTPEALQSERKKFAALAQNDKNILQAIHSEHAVHEAIKSELSHLAQALGMKKFAEKVKHYDFYILDYARVLKGNDTNTNYLTAMADFRTQQLKDIQRLKALKDIKEHYDIKQDLRDKFGSQWGLHIPDGDSTFNPLAGRFVHSAHTLTDNILDLAIELSGKSLGLDDKSVRDFKRSLSDNSGEQLLVLPNEIVQSLEQLEAHHEHGPIMKLLQSITGGWKKFVLFFPTRAFKYNLRNLTGDADALIAGNPQALKFSARAFSDLANLYFGDGNNISPDLNEFQKLGGAITIQNSQELYNHKHFKEFQKLVNELQGKSAHAWKKLPARAWALIDKFAWSGVQNFTDFREQILRYACFLSYKEQMSKNNGLPLNWGASVKDEVLALDNIPDRAFKMSNELLGAYDQVSQTGKSIREFAVPFYSWLEVNAKRYYQLLKNGLTEDAPGRGIARFLKGQLINVPYYSLKLAKTYFFINLFSLLVSAFNRLVWPEDEDKLPPDIQARPHLTLGHDSKGKVLYFDRVGALLDNLEWFGQDDSPLLPFAQDIKQILNGRQSFSAFVDKLISAPVSKAINALNPIIKTPFELAAGISLYPDFSHPRNISDAGKYIAQSLGLSWPHKILSGEPHNDWQEFKNLFLYSADADEAAYFFTLNLVRQFSENVLGKKSNSFSSTRRGEVLRKLKTALRLGDNAAVQRYLREYYSLDGTRQGLKSSMRNLNPLHSLNKKEQAQFLHWISLDERKYLNRANKFFHSMADRFLR